MASPSTPKLTTRIFLARALEVLIGASAASIFFSIRAQLPVLHGAALTFLCVIFLPPLVSCITFALSAWIPSVLSIILLLVLPAVHDANFPMTAFVILISVVSLPAIAEKSTTTCVIIAATAALGIHVPYICKTLHALIALPAPTLLVALVATSLSLHTASHRVLVNALSPRPHFRKPAQTNAGRPESSRTGRGRSGQTRSKKKSGVDRGSYTRSNANSVVGMSTASALTFAIALAVITLITRPLTHTIRTACRRHLPEKYEVLSQTWSTTGLITVVEKRHGHRMLVADRSVLGGYFVMPGHAPDSIFGQFYVHEAVRLSRRSDPDPGNRLHKNQRGGRNGHTLCIGIGVGVVTSALRILGCTVDAVELDPAVAAAATRWFGLHGDVHVADGRKFVQMAGEHLYDYVIHDAFTGGGISAALISERELYAIKRVMKNDGVLAINVVTGLNGLSTAVVTTVYDRLHRIFGHVRMFNDGHNDSINNIVMFASAVETGVQFRRSVERDYLGSELRRMILEKFEDKEIARDEFKSSIGHRLLSNIGIVNNVPFLGRLLEEAELQIGLLDVAWRHSNVMDRAHPRAMWPALLDNADIFR